MRSGQPDVLIVGAGVVGAACALALSREGARVLVIDADFVGGGSTAAAMGHLVVMDDSEAELQLSAYSRRLWAELSEELPPDCEDERRGTLWVASAPEEMDAVHEKRERYVRHGIAAEVVDERALAEMEPHLRRGLAGALHVPDDCVLYPPAAARYLAARARELGAEVRERCMAASVDGRTVRVSERAGAEYLVSAGAVVNAAGIDAPRLTPGLQIIPRKGQLLIGSSRELVGRDPEVNRELLASMLRRAIEFMPVLEHCNATRAWTGFRPATPDALPLIGPWEGAEGVWIAAGHEGLGITMAPGTGALIADGIMGRTPAIDPTPFAPGRSMPAAAEPAGL
jgi:glycine/D-amino acid oxidase-like deaminating enzyme